MRAIPCFVLVLASCASKGISNQELSDLHPAEVGNQIVVCGKRYSTGAPVVLWTDPGGYDATTTELFFDPPARDVETPAAGSLRYAPGRHDRATGRQLVSAGSSDVLALQDIVDQFVIHYDRCGLSQTCFKVLHDRRGLSVHFMIDIDGTIYQTLDLRETAWHAAKANTRSIGVEVANMGAYRIGDKAGERVLDKWYRQDDFGTRIELPGGVGDGGVRVRGFVGRPARSRPVRGPVQGEVRVQYDFTSQQYDSLVKLTATLCRVFPKLQPDTPRERSGRVQTDVLDDAEWRAFSGVIGHNHISSAKQDPGPAFDWERYLARVRTRLAAGGS
ncbi:MAG: N-acetylmuramoyl-L-alanine amidase [bacterium]|nr:N-acetylmuramoyl-L-alanine amidase [bacterium]